MKLQQSVLLALSLLVSVLLHVSTCEPASLGVADDVDDVERDHEIQAALAVLAKYRLLRGDRGKRQQRVIIPYREGYIWG
jgi:hypothetical protein